MLIRAETASDHAAIRMVNRRAFGQEGEARLVDALRAGGHVLVSLVAEIEGRVVGHILFSRLSIVTDPGNLAAASLAPMAVLPEFQRQGIGSRLVAEGLRRCAALGERIVVVLGHPDYYPRFGFTAGLAATLQCPYGEPGPAWMALELTPGALAGVRGRVEYPPPFAELG
jgi:putative acetyltransferase